MFAMSILSAGRRVKNTAFDKEYSMLKDNRGLTKARLFVRLVLEEAGR